jgi:WD40 repeat protein
MWDARSGKEVEFDVPMHCKRLTTALVFSPDGRRLASNGYDGDVQLWDARTGTSILTLPSAAGPRANDIGFSPRVVFSADGRWLAANDYGANISLFRGGPDASPGPSHIGSHDEEWLRWWHGSRAEAYQKAGHGFAEQFHRQRLLELRSAD